MNISTTIDRCAGYQGMSDDQLHKELEAQEITLAAIANFRSAIEEVNRLSTQVRINPDAFDDFVHDWVPEIGPWTEKIREARNV